MFGIDISNIQRNMNLRQSVNFDFAIIKATEGKNFVDKKLSSYAKELIELDKLIGCYHFARPDLQITPYTMQQEAENFIRNVEKNYLLGRAILVLDWEKAPIDREDLISAWIEYVLKTTGIHPLIYCNKSHYNIIKKYDIVKSCGLWIAAWPTINKIEVGNLPKPVSFPDDTPWLIWQYSSNGSWPNYTGRVDLDYTGMNKESWIALATGNAIQLEELSDDFKWCIQNGIIKGFADGTFRPNQNVTRNQAAAMLRRLYDIIMRER